MERHVLIVDDDPIILRVASLHLREAGYRVTTSSNPLTLAMELRIHKPGLVLLDVEMPAIRGTEVLGALRRTSCHDEVKIVLFSSLSDTVLEQLSKEFSAAGYIRKASPLSGESLVERVAEHFMEVEDSAPLALVADDSATMRRILTGALREAGFCVVQAADGAEVADVLDREPEIRVVLADINMPEVEGVDLMRRIREHPATSRAQVLLVTCESDRKRVDQVMRSGANLYLPKPFTRAELTTAIGALQEVSRATG